MVTREASVRLSAAALSTAAVMVAASAKGKAAGKEGEK